MIAPLRIRRGHKLRTEPKRRKAFGGKLPQPVHALAIGRKAVDLDHPPQHFQSSRHLTRDEFLQITRMLHGVKMGAFAPGVNALGPRWRWIGCSPWLRFRA